jgi:hypothetical protein
MAEADSKPTEAAAAPPAETESRLGRFITKYATVLSSTVLGVAGLAATSIWQFRQSDTAKQQADAQQKAADTAAENSWKIERADILAKNLPTLAATGSNSVEQKYGVLLSLTRGNILDPELAVTYALELGKDSPDDMQSVLSNTKDKNYLRLSRAYSLSCDERYGTSPAVELCNDKLAPRSAALGQLFADDAESAMSGVPITPGDTRAEPAVTPAVGPASAKPELAGPLVLLSDERTVEANLQRDVAIFSPFLTGLYERRQWSEIDKLAALSQGAHLISALVLAAARTGEFVTDDEAKQLDQFHAAQTKWLVDFLAGKTCDADCKSRMLDVMLTHYQEAQGDYDTAMRNLLEGPRAQSGAAVSHLHARLLWCQLDDTDQSAFRDQVLVPAALEVLENQKTDPAVRDAILALVPLVPEPNALDVTGAASWNALTAILAKNEKLDKTLEDRRATAKRQRTNPPPAFKKQNFCGPVDASAAGSATDAAASDPTAGATNP